MRLSNEARQTVKSLEEGVLGGDLAQATDLSAEPLALLGPFGQPLFKVPQRGQGRVGSGRPSSSAQIGRASRRGVTDARCLCAARGPLLAFASSAMVAWMAWASHG
jgi:hypothetical protein